MQLPRPFYGGVNALTSIRVSVCSDNYDDEMFNSNVA